MLAHYAQDMCQPLHLTIDFNGRKLEDGSKAHKGIHERVDALPETLGLDPDDLARGQNVAPIEQLMPEIIAQLKRGHGLVDRVYELAPRVPRHGAEDWAREQEVVDFALERTRESVRFTASLVLTAWRLSEGLKIEGWLDRSKDDIR